MENHTVLQVECGGAALFYGLGLNDIVLFKKSAENTIELDIFCDEIKVSGFRGDGVVFATPTGSTAYAMSTEGPIVDASLEAIIVAQICAHIVHTPPMVFSGTPTLRAVPKGDEIEKVYITCDGLEMVIMFLCFFLVLYSSAYNGQIETLKHEQTPRDCLAWHNSPYGGCENSDGRCKSEFIWQKIIGLQ